MPKPLTREEVIKRFKEKHGEKYDYSRFTYKNIKAKGIIICPIHGEFQQTAEKHFKSDCNECGHLKAADKRRKSQEEFLEQLKDLFEDDYDYSKVKYKSNHIKVELICKIDDHGPFQTTPAHLLTGYGCPICGRKKAAEAQRADFTERVFGNLTAIKPSPNPYESDSTFWELKCTCGRTEIKNSCTLVDKKRPITMCTVCSLRAKELRKEKKAWEEMENKKFNKLTIIRLWGTRKSKRRVIANCDCGGQIICNYSSIKCGVVKSCGCIPRGADSYHYYCSNTEFTKRDTTLYLVEVKNKYHKIGISFDLNIRSQGDFTDIFYERVLPRAKARAVELIALNWTQDFFPDLSDEWLNWDGYTELRESLDLAKTIEILNTLVDESEDMTWEEFWVKYGLTTGAEPQYVQPDTSQVDTLTSDQSTSSSD